MFIRTVQHNSALDAFREEVRAFCQTEMPAEVRRKQARGEHLERHEYDAWLKRRGARGWLTGKWPTEHGGLGWDALQMALAYEELGRVDQSVRGFLTVHLSLVAQCLEATASDAQKRTWLPRLASGEVLGAYALTEKVRELALEGLRKLGERSGAGTGAGPQASGS